MNENQRIKQIKQQYECYQAQLITYTSDGVTRHDELLFIVAAMGALARAQE